MQAHALSPHRVLGALVLAVSTVFTWPTTGWHAPTARLSPTVLIPIAPLLAGLTLAQARRHNAILQLAAALAATPILLAGSSLAQSDYAMAEITGFSPSQPQTGAAIAADADSDMELAPERAHPNGLTDDDIAPLVAALGDSGGPQEPPDSAAVAPVTTRSSAAALVDPASTIRDPISGTPLLAASLLPPSGAAAQAEGMKAPIHAATSSLAKSLTDPVNVPVPFGNSDPQTAAAQAEGLLPSTASSAATASGDRQAAVLLLGGVLPGTVSLAATATGDRQAADVCGSNPAPVNLAPAASR